MTLRRPGASPSRPLHPQEPPARTELFVFGIAGRYFVTRPAPRAQSLRRLQVITKGKGRVGRRRGAPPAEHRPRGHHPDRRSRRFGCSGAARSPEPPYHPPAPTRPPRRPLQLTVSPPVARRCVSGMVKPAAGGQLTPWMLVASSTTSASSTGRWAPPCPLHLPRRLARRTVARGARLAERRARHPVGPFPRLWAVRPRSL